MGGPTQRGRYGAAPLRSIEKRGFNVVGADSTTNEPSLASRLPAEKTGDGSAGPRNLCVFKPQHRTGVRSRIGAGGLYSGLSAVSNSRFLERTAGFEVAHQRLYGWAGNSGYCSAHQNVAATPPTTESPTTACLIPRVMAPVATAPEVRIGSFSRHFQQYGTPSTVVCAPHRLHFRLMSVTPVKAIQRRPCCYALYVLSADRVLCVGS